MKEGGELEDKNQRARVSRERQIRAPIELILALAPFFPRPRVLGSSLPVQLPANIDNYHYHTNEYESPLACAYLIRISSVTFPCYIVLRVLRTPYPDAYKYGMVVRFSVRGGGVTVE